MSAALPTPKLLDKWHPALVANGWKLLQPYRFGKTDEEHVEWLSKIAHFPFGARVLDIGCGMGEVARLMSKRRPDLKFTLLNYSLAQVQDCPKEFTTIHADAHDMPLASDSFDGVMFHAALGHMDMPIALAEASRVLKVGGKLLINDLCRTAGDDELLLANAGVRAYWEDDIRKTCRDMGFGEFIWRSLPLMVIEWLGAQWHSDNATPYTAAFHGVEPGVWTGVKSHVSVAATHGNIFYRHANVALSYSGGKDSLACLNLFKPWWDRLTVYWLNTGDAFPETIETMRTVKEIVPHFAELAGCQPKIIAEDGWPSDIVPHNYTTDGNLVYGETPFKLQTRSQCCIRSMMMPALNGMLKNGVTCIIRGKRHDEHEKTGLPSGYVSKEGVELIFPIYEWTSAQVHEYLKKNNIPLPSFYKHGDHSMDCMHCTAYWEDDHESYLRNAHPELHTEYVRRIKLIKSAVRDQLARCDVGD